MRSGLRIMALCAVTVCVAPVTRAGLAPIQPGRALDPPTLPVQIPPPFGIEAGPGLSVAFVETRAAVPAAADQNALNLSTPLPEPRPIDEPVPPALWSGLLTLIGLALATSLRTTRRWLV